MAPELCSGPENYGIVVGHDEMPQKCAGSRNARELQGQGSDRRNRF